MTVEILEDHELSALDLGKEEWVVDNLFNLTDRVLVVGTMKVGKSIFALQLASCVAGKVVFLGFDVPKPLKVLYIAGEGDIRELQKRRKRMEKVIPTLKDHLYFWSIPSNAFNTPAGKKDLINVGLEYKPQLTIFDPVYSLMSGSMTKDENVGDFVRAVNVYQHTVKSAIVVLHHTHRAIKVTNMWNDTAKIIDEGDDAFFGSMLFKAWPHMVFLLTKNADGSRALSCNTHREDAPLNEPLQLTLVAPDPLLYTLKRDGYTSTDESILALLKVGGEKNEAEIESVLKKSHTTLSQSLVKLIKNGEVLHDGGWPRKYKIK